MAYSTDLFDLIQSMSKSEKRYFKLFSSIQSGNKVYIALFNALSKQVQYDEEKLRKQLKIKAFATVKNYLYNLILRSLRSQQLHQNISLQLKDMLKDLEILYQKGLYQQCSRLLTRARKIAKQYEKHIHLLELCQYEHLLTSLNLDPFHRKRLIERGFEEVSDALAAYTQLSDYRNKILIMTNYMHSQGRRNKNMEDKKELMDTLKPIINSKPPSKFLSYKSGILYYNIKELFESNELQYQKAYESSKKYIEHMESNPFLLNEEMHNYLVGLNNLMNMQQVLGLFEEMKVNLEKLKALDLPTETEKIRAMEYTLPKEIVYYVYTERYEEGISHVPVVERQISRYKDKMGKPFLLSLYANIVELYIISGNIRKALQWNNKILNTEEIETYVDYYTNSRLCEIIIHYELGNAEKVESLIKSYQLLLGKSKREYHYENILAKFLKSLVNKEEEKEVLKIFKSIKEELTRLLNDPFEKGAFDFFDIMIWIDKNIKKYSSRSK